MFKREDLQKRHHSRNRIANEIGGKYNYHKGELTLKYKFWKIVLDQYVRGSGAASDHTRVRVVYLYNSNFRFRIINRSFLYSCFTFGGIKIGRYDFDKNFIIKGNDKSKIMALFNNAEIQSILQKIVKYHPGFYLEILVRKHFFWRRLPSGLDEMQFISNECVERESLVKDLFKLFQITLDGLVELGLVIEQLPVYKRNLMFRDLTLNFFKNEY